MIPIFVEAALRSLLVASAVAVGLRHAAAVACHGRVESAAG